MISFVRGDLLEAPSLVLVNPVNCVGIMGAGLALQFRRAFPLNYVLYRLKCSTGLIKPGELFTFTERDKVVVNFPTKVHYNDKSIMSHIESGLQALIDLIKVNEFESCAIPALGCGLGGLNWEDVKLVILNHLELLPSVRFLVYEPQ